jgi:hypothetical protein
MRKIFTLLCLIATVFTVNAQLAIDPCPVNVTGSAGDILIKGYADVLNNSNAPGYFAWERVDVSIPSSWSTSVCDPNQCYAPFADEPLNASSEIVTFNVGANGSTPDELFYVQVQPNGEAGTGSVTLRVYEEANPSNEFTCVFTLDALSTGISNVDVEINPVLFPNPVVDVLNVSVQKGTSSVEIYNLIGSMVERFSFSTPQTEMKVNLSHLKEGIYFIRLLDADDSPIGSRRFSKQG